RTYMNFIPWREQNPDLTQELRSLLLTMFADCQEAVGVLQPFKKAAIFQGHRTPVDLIVSSAISRKVWFYALSSIILLGWNLFFPHPAHQLFTIGVGMLIVGFWLGQFVKDDKRETSVAALWHNGAQDPYDPAFIHRSMRELKQHVFLKKHQKYIGRCVAMFGGAQVVPGSQDYEDAVHLARMINCPIVTGGGPGIMEAANKGAQESAKNNARWNVIRKSIGLTITLPHEPKPNPYLDIDLHFEKDLFARKTTFFRFCKAYVICPGGFGTLDELFDVLTLVDRGFLRTHIYILNSNGFYAPLLRLIEELRDKGFLSMSRIDLDRYVHVFDTLEGIRDHINALPVRIKTFHLDFSNIENELLLTQQRLDEIKKAVSILGSGQAIQATPRYRTAVRDLSYLVSSQGVCVMARSVARIGRSVDAGVEKAKQEAPAGFEVGKFINLKTKTQIGDPDPDIMVEYSHIFLQKIGLIKYSSAFVFFPGGFGTLSLLFEVITLIKTHKMAPVPLILAGERFWRPWNDFIINTLLTHHLIGEDGPFLYTITRANAKDILRTINDLCAKKSNGTFFPPRMGAEAEQDPDLMKIMNFLKPVQGLGAQHMERYLYADGAQRCSRKVAWVKNNPELVKRQPGESLKDWMMRVYVQENLGIDAKQIRVAEATETKVVLDYFNRCLVLEACQSLGLDTTKVCRCAFDRCYDVLMKSIDPGLSFKREYVYDKEGNVVGGVRPYAEFCREIITYNPTQENPEVLSSPLYILIVDDQKVQRDRLQHILKLQGHH
ncbi:MAG TPA: LOG family protein, partial [Candidatus Omnitrophota bacterium]|nr:LOG family protein [Candidatus Omnitrophota bacterium]